MTRSRFPVAIDGSELEVARRYICQQFEQRSWWPTEGPLQAQTDFAAAQDNALDLAAWCHKWLNAAQRRALAQAIRSARLPSARS
ncbi:hypothetical protein EWI61_10385 [Methylolobus aquaticus]|nr:hypothetical protein EWI61_10385 [Methylolobus aquaticus]